MHLSCQLIGLLIVCLATHTHGQFWRKRPSGFDQWEVEMQANRPSGICYKTEFVNTLNPELRKRTTSFCCIGYVNLGTSQSLKCEPICREDCSNGLCLSPHYCECAPGYYREEARCRRYGE